jgi:uncharacterized protein
MAIKIEKTFQVQQPLERVWAFLSDPRKVVTCVPGAQITEQVDERTYKGAISVKVGPTVTDFRGEVQIVRLDAQAHEMELVGKGQDTHGKGGASMKMTGKLRALPDGGTEVTSISELSIVGILAQVGSRMIQEVSNIMFQQFTSNFIRELGQIPEAQTAKASPAAAPPAAAKPIKVIPLALSALWAAIKRLFGGSRKKA